MVVINPATVAIAAQAGATGFKAAQQASKSLAGYDFIGLITRIVVFYVVALIIAKIMEFIVFSSAGITTAAKMFGIPLPNSVPEPIRKLFVEGYDVGGMKIKWWDLIKLIAVFLVVFEMFQFLQQQKAIGQKPAPTTLGIFVLIIAALTLLSVPDLLQMTRERNMITTGPTISGNTQVQIDDSGTTVSIREIRRLLGIL